MLANKSIFSKNIPNSGIRQFGNKQFLYVCFFTLKIKNSSALLAYGTLYLKTRMIKFKGKESPIITIIKVILIQGKYRKEKIAKFKEI